ncbi:uncharacterized protein FIBRA_06316 [Fibroporia radiculosa]|uniref:MYND-type domain-containing protein n=1 Tax=Fibroporia radiculosa TaxID=599839 RepID=J4H405_9APHY|nr:uncharacterized protein FIBRA_06316 [Fibroporia radiculosa]CCM04154.1 predicted protein [Fibroporia radiculosa]
MNEILRRPGYLNAGAGGQRLRALYQDQSKGFECNLLHDFALSCYLGQAAVDSEAIQRGIAPDLTQTETPYKFGYCTFVVAGAQRAESGDKDYPATMRTLLSMGRPPDAPDIVGLTALHHATQNPAGCALELGRILLTSGANVNFQNRYGEVPLMGPCQNNTIDAIELLMEFNADVDIKEADGLCIRDMYLRMGLQVTASITKWLRKRTGEELPMTEKKCDSCGKKTAAHGSLKICSKCHAVRYCSLECQRSHWPTHKRTCSPFTTTNSVTVRPNYRAMTQSPISTAYATRVAMGIPSPPPPGTARPRAGACAPRLCPGEVKAMIIKVQLPQKLFGMETGSTLSGDLMVYNKKRDFLCTLTKAENPGSYARLFEVVKEKGVGGCKAYFPAELRAQYELVIKVGEVLAEQPF